MTANIKKTDKNVDQETCNKMPKNNKRKQSINYKK